MSCTLTSEGHIQHHPHPGGFEMPVKLRVKRSDKIYTLTMHASPVRSPRGTLVFALPGGGSFISERI